MSSLYRRRSPLIRSYYQRKKNNVERNSKSRRSTSSRKKELGKPKHAESSQLPASNARQDRHRPTNYEPPHADPEESSADERQGNSSDAWQSDEDSAEDVENERIGLYVNEDEDENEDEDQPKDEEPIEEEDIHKSRTECAAGDKENDVEDAVAYAQIQSDDSDGSDSEGQTVTGYARAHRSPVASTSTHRQHLEDRNINALSRLKVPSESKGRDSRSPTSGPAS